jgi:hypothetical protein
MPFCKASFGFRQMSYFDGGTVLLSAGETASGSEICISYPQQHRVESICDLAIGAW